MVALRGALPDHLKVVSTIGYYTGMRLGEILSLRWEHIDWDHGMMRLDPGRSCRGHRAALSVCPGKKTQGEWVQFR